jgi:hypothetical protein
MNLKLLQGYYDGPEYLALLRAKAETLKEMEGDEYLRAQKILDIYAVDPVRFIQDFMLIKANKAQGSPPKPFFLFEYQKRIIYKLMELDQGDKESELLIDKPREMGITWLLCAYFEWRWLFTPNYSSFILSRSEEEVDDGTRTPDGSIFGKLRWMLDRVPRYIIPATYQKKVVRGTTTDMNLKLINPSIGSSITGSSTNSEAGRSRRYSALWIDEAFAIDRFQEVYRSIQTVSKIKVFTSTVAPGKVYEDFKKAREAEGNYISLTWKDHPFKDQEWYDGVKAKAEMMNDPELMREAEPTYAINPKAAYYPNITKAKLQPLEYAPRLPLYESLDIGGKQDLTVVIDWQFDGTTFYCLDAYHNRNRPVRWYAPFMNPEAPADYGAYTEYQQKEIEKRKGRKKPVAYFGEADHFAQRHPTNTSSAQELARDGIRLVYNSYAIKHQPRRQAMELLIPRIVFNSSSDGAMRVYDALAQSRYAGKIAVSSENPKPVHDDEIADFRAAAENFAANVPRILRLQREALPPGGEDRDFHSTMIKNLRI